MVRGLGCSVGKGAKQCLTIVIQRDMPLPKLLSRKIQPLIN
jgi:hypothetical protein